MAAAVAYAFVTELGRMPRSEVTYALAPYGGLPTLASTFAGTCGEGSLF